MTWTRVEGCRRRRFAPAKNLRISFGLHRENGHSALPLPLSWSPLTLCNPESPTTASTRHFKLAPRAAIRA